MENNLQNVQRAEQAITLAPAQQRSLEILQKPSLELQKYIEEQLEQNPLLELDETGGEPAPQTVGEDPDESPDAIGDASYGDAAQLEAKRDFLLNSEPEKTHLGEKLVAEARIDAESDAVADAFEELVELLDARGYLPADALERLKAAGTAPADAEAALRLLQNCEPAGIGARDVRESFLMQLRAKKMSGSLAYRILEDNFDLFMKRRVDEIARLQSRPISDVEAAIGEIAKLNPSPAYEYTVDAQSALLADVEFYKEGGEWRARLTNQYLPRLRINAEYRQMLAGGSLDSATASYIKEKIRDGKSVIEAIKQRQATLLKISLAILARQKAFFESGELAPMTRQEIADDIGVHPTTVGRAVHGKNADTPFGIVELKNFFTNTLETGEGADISSETAREKLRDIIAAEDPEKPLSDAKICDILKREGVNLARRTVAKYREELGIPVKSLRRRF